MIKNNYLGIIYVKKNIQQRKKKYSNRKKLQNPVIYSLMPLQYITSLPLHFMRLYVI